MTDTGRQRTEVSTNQRSHQGDATTAAQEGFDLLCQPWVPVVRDCVETQVSLRDAVLLAHEFDSLSLADGPQFAGLLRLLVALTMSVYGRPTSVDEWANTYRQKHFGAATLDAYVDTVGRPHFDLFDADRPFLQSATVFGDPKTNGEIMPHVSTGNSVAIFSPDTERKPRSITPAQAARGLVGSMAVAVSGLGLPTKIEGGKWAGIAFGGRVGQIGFVAPMGINLFDTIMLNTPVGTNPPGDAPAWQRKDAPPSGRTRRQPTGMLDMLTWCPRRALLIRNPDGNVTHLRMLGGDGLTVLDKDFEPHTGWRTSDGKDSRNAGEVYQRKHTVRTLGWRGMETLLALSKSVEGNESAMVFIQLSYLEDVLPDDYPIAVAGLNCEYGGSMAATFKDIAFDVFSLPFQVFGKNEQGARSNLVDMVKDADKAGNMIRKLAWAVSRVVLRDTSKKSTFASGYANQMRARFTSDVEVLTRRFLAGLTTHPSAMKQGVAAWKTAVRELADAYCTEIMATATGSLFTMLVESQSGKRKVLANPPTDSESVYRREIKALLPTPEEKAEAFALAVSKAGAPRTKSEEKSA